MLVYFGFARRVDHQHELYDLPLLLGGGPGAKALFFGLPRPLVFGSMFLIAVLTVLLEALCGAIEDLSEENEFRGPRPTGRPMNFLLYLIAGVSIFGFNNDGPATWSVLGLCLVLQGVVFISWLGHDTARPKATPEWLEDDCGKREPLLGKNAEQACSAKAPAREQGCSPEKSAQNERPREKTTGTASSEGEEDDGDTRRRAGRLCVLQFLLYDICM